MHMTLKDVYDVIDADQKKKKDEIEYQEYLAWQSGMYIMEAISATLGNWLCQPKEPFKYPENPFKPKETEEERIERELKQMIANEEAYIAVHKSHGLKVQTTDNDKVEEE